MAQIQCKEKQEIHFTRSYSNFINSEHNNRLSIYAIKAKNRRT